MNDNLFILTYTNLKKGIIKVHTIPRKDISTENFNKELKQKADDNWPEKADSCIITTGQVLEKKNT